MKNNEVEMEIDLLGLLSHLRKKIVIILLVTVLCAVLGLLFSMLFITPQYTAATRMYVLNRTNENTVVSADFQVSNYMISDYQELIKGRNVTSQVIAQLGLNMTDESLSRKITVSSPDNTRILHISVTDSDPVQAAQIANTVRQITSEQLTNIMQVDSATTIYEAIVPKEPSSPNVTKNAALAGIVGLVLIVGLFSVIYIMDDRIRTEDDVERYLGLSTLGVIPDNGEVAVRAKKPTPKAQKPVKK